MPLITDDVPSVSNRLKFGDLLFRGPVGQAFYRKLCETMNYIQDGYRLPPAAIIDWMGAEADVPAGWDVPDGREVSRAGIYANLYAIAGPFCGTGNGTTTWNLPDIRGATTRMVDTTVEGTAGKDPDVAGRVPANGTATPGQPGSYQADAMIVHQHSVRSSNGGSGGGWSRIGDATDDSNLTGAAGTGSETRMKNVLVLKIIKL